MCRSLCEIVIKLRVSATVFQPDRGTTHLQGFLVVLNIVAVNIVMRANRFSQFWSNNKSWALCRWASSKEHDTSTSILERRFHETNSYAKGYPSTSQISPIASYWPRIFLQLLEGFRKLEFALLDRKEESSCRSHGRDGSTRLLLLHARPKSRSRQSKHLLDLLCGIILTTSEDVRLGTFCIANFVNLGLKLVRSVNFMDLISTYHGTKSDQAH